MPTITQTVQVPPLDPIGAFSNPYRTWNGLLKMGAVTYDVDYGDGIYAKALYVGAAGAASLKLIDGTIITIPGLAAGMVYPFWTIGIVSAGTTIAAGNIFWGY